MTRPRSLYVTRNGLLEPLGQSQVLAYLRGLSRDYDITLITYEKPRDWADSGEMERMRALCRSHGIRWRPRRFRARPRYLASVFGFAQLVWLIWTEARAGRAGLVHARSYIPAAAAMVAGRVTGTPFVFDMRALWPEELITAGRLRRGGVLHRLIVGGERACLARAARVVTLTHAAERYLRETYPEELQGRSISVIPTCADLEHFSPGPGRAIGPPVQGCIGTVLSGWFRTDWLAAWMRVAAERDGQDRFDIATRDDPARVRSALDPGGAMTARLTIAAHTPAGMPDVIRAHSVSLMLYAGGAVSELGRSPTRLAEVLGCGVPVVVNHGVGDVAEIVRRHDVGVVLAGMSEPQIAAAMEDLDRLCADPGLAARCRAAAEAEFSLEAGVAAYGEVYRAILGPGGCPG